jgi:DNA-binding transcriptional regulator YiaG
MARPSKLTPITAATAETLAKLGLTDERLAQAVGVSRSTLSEWKRTDPNRRTHGATRRQTRPSTHARHSRRTRAR